MTLNPSLPVPQEVREAMQQALDARSSRIDKALQECASAYIDCTLHAQAAMAVEQYVRTLETALRGALLHAQRVAAISDDLRDEIFSHADAQALESAENGNRTFDRGGLVQFAAEMVQLGGVHPSPAPQAEAAVPVAIPDKARRLRDVLLTEDIYLSLDAAARVMLYVETATGMAEQPKGAQ